MAKPTSSKNIPELINDLDDLLEFIENMNPPVIEDELTELWDKTELIHRGLEDWLHSGEFVQYIIWKIQNNN
mgnify:FL=1